MSVAVRPPGGLGLHVAKRVAEQVLWSRVKLQRLARSGRPPYRPRTVPPTDVLSTAADRDAATAECRRLHLPSHHDRQKNWDALGALSTLVHELEPSSAVLDAGSARYSPVLPWLRLYGFSDLIGNNLEFGKDVRRGGVTFRYGDITATDFPDGRFDAVTCLSVVEHGVPLPAFFAECARIIRPGGLLVLSTDYDQEPPDTTGHTVYGSPVHIFSPAEIEEMVRTASAVGLELDGSLATYHAERPVYWKRVGLHYTFIRLTFRRAERPGPTSA